ncbi:MAG: hypothetical protein ACRD01_11935 [Terriglobales bacterium]
MHNQLLLYGDATAHVAIARRMLDSATPGLSQWGTVWLPLPHLLMLPFVWSMSWWRSGVAGSVPALAAFVLATWLLHRIVYRHWGPVAAAWAAAFFALNPSLLYLAAVPMTETVYLAAFLGLVDQCDQGHAGRAGCWALAASLCRYDGWFVLPFALLALLVSASDLRAAWARAWRFSLLAMVGPAFWLLYNWWYLNDPLAFARGPYSARQIYLHALRHGGIPYPGDHALALAALYYGKTVALTAGVPLVLLALLGLLLWPRWSKVSPDEATWTRPEQSGRALSKFRPQPDPRGPNGAGALGWEPRQGVLRRAAVLPWLLLLPLPWYLWAMWSGNVPIFLPQYWPHGYYNLRYGVQMLPAVAACSAVFISTLLRGAARLDLPRPAAVARGVGMGLALLCAAGYALMLRPPGPVSYAEAVHNAPRRLAMEHALAAALAPREPPQRVLMYYGTYPGALADDRIPVHSVIQESNFLLWLDALYAPHRYVSWVVVEAGSPVSTMVNKRDLARYFHPVATLAIPSQPTIEVYRRNDP